MFQVRPYYDEMGQLDGFIVRRGAGFTMQIAKTFPVAPYAPAEVASRACDCAIALAITLNRKIKESD